MIIHSKILTTKNDTALATSPPNDPYAGMFTFHCPSFPQQDANGNQNSKISILSSLKIKSNTTRSCFTMMKNVGSSSLPRSSSSQSLSASVARRRSSTPVASPVNSHGLMLCEELDIDKLTLDNYGALKRGIDLEGIALCKKNGIEISMLQDYDAVKPGVDITGISMCKMNGIEIAELNSAGAILPDIDISGIAVCKSVGIDLHTLKENGFIKPNKRLRAAALLKEQGHDLETISYMIQFDASF